MALVTIQQHLEEWLGPWWTTLESWTHAVLWDEEHWRQLPHTTTTFVRDKLATYLSQIPRNAFLPILAVILVFWPLLVTLLVAFATAGSWMLWLVTSMVFGFLQFLYVCYQFLMIFINILMLSILKTYSLLRNQVINSMDHAAAVSFGTPRVRSGKSRRRQWRERVENAATYENFLKIRIEPKDLRQLGPLLQTSSHGPNANNANVGTTSASIATTSSTGNGTPMAANGRIHRGNAAVRHDPALPPAPLVRRFSFDTPRSHADDDDDKDEMPRIRSQGNLGTLGSARSSNNSNTNNHSLVDPAAAQELGLKIAHLLTTTTQRVEQARLEAETGSLEAMARLKHLLTGVVKRNHLNLDDALVENARSVHVSGRYGLTSQSRQLIRAYYEQVQRGLDYIADGPTQTVAGNNINGKPIDTTTTPTTNNHFFAEPGSPTSDAAPKSETATTANTTPTRVAPLTKRFSSGPDPASPPSSVDLDAYDPVVDKELLDRVTLIRKMKQNMGQTALMLSGGGAQAMYHCGIIRALIQSRIYHDIRVISGTSGGSIVAAMCAIKTVDELFSQVCVRTVSTDFTKDGEQKTKNIRWFPTAVEMMSYWFKHKLLMDNNEFRRTCEFYFGDYTFEEAFERTGKHVCITVSASRASGDTAQRLLLNHISTPHVTLASAVAASCALPGVMAPAKLLTKNASGVLEPFEVDGVEWIDGSVQADLPFQRISTLFAVTSFIVSQTNFHIVPFLNKAHHPNQKSLYWRLFQTLEWDIRSRALKLSRLGLFPRIFGQDISKVFKQKYHGNLTIVPRFTTMQTFGLKALSNPTVEDMESYIKFGEIATWPYLNAIRDMIRLEKLLDDCLTRLEHRLGAVNPEWHDELESLASSTNVFSSFSVASSSRVKIMGTSVPGSGGTTLRHTDRMRRKILSLEEDNDCLSQENKALQAELERLRALLSTDPMEKEAPPH